MAAQRLRILTIDEVDRLYSCPQFNDAEQRHYFILPEELLSSLKIAELNGKNTSTKLYFILQYGYFKAKHQFFKINYSKMKNDVMFIMKHYMPNDRIPTKLPTNKTQTRTKRQLLQFMQFSDNLAKIDQLTIEKASALVRKTQNPLEIFEEVIKNLESNKMVLPSYSRLQDMIGAALKNEDRRIINKVKEHLIEDARQALENLFQTDKAFYNITELKFDAKSFHTQEIKNEINKLTMCKPIYDFSKGFLPTLSLSRRMIEYYSDLAKVYSVSRLKKIPTELAYFYIICYVHNRCERFITNHIQAFIYYVDKYHDEAKRDAKKNLPTIISELDQYKISIGKLMEFYTNKKIMKLPGKKIQQHAFNVMPEEQITVVSKSLLSEKNSRTKQEQLLIWEYHKENYQAILINLRPLFLAIEFEGSLGLKNLLDASKFMKEMFKQENSLKDIKFDKIPIAHIRPKSLLNCFIKVECTKSGKVKKNINQYQYGVFCPTHPKPRFMVHK